MVARNKTVAIANRLGITPAEAAHYCEIIRALDPHPGARFFRPDETRYVTPDVYILRRAEGWQILLNDRDIPAVTVNSYYQKLYRRTEDAETKAFLEKKLGQAEWAPVHHPAAEHAQAGRGGDPAPAGDLLCRGLGAPAIHEARRDRGCSRDS